MLLLAVCSLIVVFITVERLLLLRSSRLVHQETLQAWQNWFTEKSPNHPALSPENPSILTQIFLPIIDFFPLSHTRFEERIADLSRKQKHKLERGLVFLDTIAGIAPLFGLLGTALGMVEVFSQLSTIGDVKMQSLSSGIAQALFTTVAGLCVGIPALVANNLLSRHIDNILMTTEDQVNLLVDEFGHLMIREEQQTDHENN